MKKVNKNVLLAMGLIFIVIISVIFKIITSKEKEIEEYNFQELYLEKADMTDFKEASELFHTDKVMTYDEYVQFCVEWNLEQVYDKEGKYAIHAKMYDGVRSTDMDKVIQKGKHIDAVAICYGVVNTEYITIDFLVIPVKNKIETITYMERID